MMRKSSVFLRKGGASLARNGYRVNPGTGLLAARRRAGYLQRAYPSRATEQDDQLSSPWPRDRKERPILVLPRAAPISSASA
jgi:hypothetical protein